MAVHRKRAKQGEQQKTDFVECVFWRHNAEFLSRYAHKGDNVVVFGELQNESWTDQQGNKRSKTVIVADEAQLNKTKAQDAAVPEAQFEPIASSDDTLPF